jgi:hypothetical protein
MHKKSRPDKKTGARNRRPGGFSARQAVLRHANKPKLINDLILIKPGLRRLAARIPAQQSWLQWLRETVTAELAGHIVSAVPKNGQLVVFADSAGWGTRLRYALAAMQPDIAARDSAIADTTVRVQRQAGSSRPSGG